MSSALDPLDPSVPLETVEAWIASPGTARSTTGSVPQQVVETTTYAPVQESSTVQYAAPQAYDVPVQSVAPTPAAPTQYAEPPQYVAAPVAPVQYAAPQTYQADTTFQPAQATFQPAQTYQTSETFTATESYLPTQDFTPSAVETVQVTEEKVITPVRSPGIVLPAPEPKPEPVVEETAVEHVAEEETRPLSRRLLPWLFLVLGVLGALIALAQLVPGWWSNFIAGLVDGYSARGAGWGAAMGFVFTYAATMLIGHAFHKWSSWKAPIALVVGGLIVAAPNLFTLWINHGPTTAARTANALLDRSAPLFRGASLAGAAGGLVLGILTTVLYRMWRKRTRRIKAMESLVDDYA